MSTILFDMDGTLTPARRKITKEMISVLCRLSRQAPIGIVTGSGIDYVLEQCGALWQENGIDPSLLTLFPCNGTQAYSWKLDRWVQVYMASMEDALGPDFRKLIKVLLELQYKFAHNSNHDDVPIIGHFISYRESMLNWCPMGRDANFSYRDEFVKKDNEKNIRKDLHTKFNAALVNAGIDGIQASIGGNTSIDVYPTGWDKSFVLRHLEGIQAWFVGDACEPDGNDYALHTILSQSGRSFVTTGPEQTIEIIKNNIIPKL